MKVSPITSASLSSPISAVRPMQYTVQNQSEVSAAYEASIEASAVSDVKAASPVQYANAQIVKEPSVPAIDTKQLTAVNQSFNQIAERFAGASTGYASSGAPQSYDVIGSSFDAFI